MAEYQEQFSGQVGGFLQRLSLGQKVMLVAVTLAGTLLMGNLENAPLPAAWRAVARLTYPLDLPELRKVRMNFPLGWFNVRHIPVVAERVQTDTYLACVILSETLGHMLDSFVRDYLVERVESLVGHRLVNGYYPRLGLAPGERFASKGAYLVRFAGREGARVVAPERGETPALESGMRGARGGPARHPLRGEDHDHAGQRDAHGAHRGRCAIARSLSATTTSTWTSASCSWIARRSWA